MKPMKPKLKKVVRAAAKQLQTLAREIEKNNSTKRDPYLDGITNRTPDGRRIRNALLKGASNYAKLEPAPTRVKRIHVDVITTHTNLQPDERARGIIERQLTHRATFTNVEAAIAYRKSVKHLREEGRGESTDITTIEE